MSHIDIDKTTSSPRRNALRGALLVAVLSAMIAGFIQLSLAPAAAYTNGGDTDNKDVYAPSSGVPTSFTVVFNGNQLNDLGVPPSEGNSGTINEPNWADPFCNPNPSGNECPIAFTYSPTSDTTTLVFSGSQLYSNTGISGTYHFGYVLDGQEYGQEVYALQTMSSYWTYSPSRNNNASNQPPYPNLIAYVPMLSLKCECKATSKSLVAIVFYESTAVAGNLPVASWTIIPYDPAPNGAQPAIKFSNYEQQSAKVYNTGVLLGIKAPTDNDGWVQLLSTMNAAGMPPPGADGSPFVALTKAPPPVLKPEKPGKGDLQTRGRPIRRR
jgi:hypothetical protein